MEERVIIKISIHDHLNDLKNINIKSFLQRLDESNIDDTEKANIRTTFLDSFNAYHRSVKSTVNKLFKQE